jgi:DNA-binding IclR family transcriptional regulator
MTVVRSAPGESVTSRALSVLDAFDDAHALLTLTQVARRAGLPLATASRRVRDLVDGRLLVKTADHRYAIGPRMWHLGLLSAPTSMREAALPHLQDLVAATGHTVHLAVLDGLAVLVVERISGTGMVPTRHTPGSRLPLHCTAVGKVVLANAPPEVQEQAMRTLTRHTPHTTTDAQVLRAQLADIRARGIARSVQEHRMGVSSAAAPVLTAMGTRAGVAVIAPVATSRLGRVTEPLRACAAAITVELAAVEAARRY